MNMTYSVVEIQCLKDGWVYIDMWKEPLPAGLLRQHGDLRIYVRPWASKWTEQERTVASGLSAEEARKVVNDERNTIELGFFRGNTSERVLPSDVNAPVGSLLMHVSWSDMARVHPELNEYKPET